MLRTALLCLLSICASSLSLRAADLDSGWSEPVAVTLGNETCVTYRAILQDNWLIVRADHHDGWHSYALDNELRVAEQLAGRPALGVEAPTTIEVCGVETTGPWRQTPPVDFSKPDLRWYRFGFDGRSYFAIQLAHPPGKPVQINIRGQTCDEKRCQRVDVQIAVSATEEKLDWRPIELEPVRVKVDSES